MKAATLATLAALLCLLPTGAGADGDDYARTGPYLGIGGTYAFHWWKDVDGDFGGITVRTDDSFGIDVRAGYRALSWLAGEIEYEWLEGMDNRAFGTTIFSLRSHTITANAKALYPGWGRFQPYAKLGIGGHVYEARETRGPAAGLEDSSAGFVIRAGAGVEAYVTEHILVNFGIDGVFPTTDVDNSAGGDLTTLYYIPIQLGVQYRF